MEKSLDPKYIDVIHYKRYKWDIDATRLLITKAAFQRLVRTVARDFKSDLRFMVDGITALQAVAESHLVKVFEDANLCAIHAKRQRLFSRDMILATKLRRETVPKED